MKGEQLPLSVQLNNAASLDNYYAGPNALAVNALRGLAAGANSGILIFGAASIGKTHLLQAVARATHARQQRVIYLPLASLGSSGASSLEGLSGFDCVCIDDLQTVAGDAAWEVAVIRLLDQLRAQGGHWLAASTLAPERLPLALPDLRTRLSAGAIFGLRALSDEDRQHWLHQAARQRGLELPDDASRWLLTHLPRDAGSLSSAIETLDRAALRAKRRLTLSFVQQTLSGAA